MCHFITATLPGSSNLQLMAEIFEEQKLGFERILNPHVRRQIEPGDIQILTTRGHCDCGTVLGSLDRNGADLSHDYEREVGRLRMKGWSGQKIRRWIGEKEQTKARQLREDSQMLRNRTPEARRWIEFLTAVLESGATSRIGLLVHVYHGGIESDRIEILRIERVRLGELIPQSLMRMKEDLIYEFFVWKRRTLGQGR